MTILIPITPDDHPTKKVGLIVDALHSRGLSSADIEEVVENTEHQGEWRLEVFLRPAKCFHFDAQ